MTTLFPQIDQLVAHLDRFFINGKWVEPSSDATIQVISPTTEEVYRAARAIRSGTVGQNGMRTDFGIAFGGFKQSGIGREGGVEGLMPFLETKTIILDAEPAFS